MALFLACLAAMTGIAAIAFALINHPAHRARKEDTP